jgi:type II secretory pathway pseudopilin PulG
MNRIKRHLAGFTLLETIIAAAIVTVVLGGSIGLNRSLVSNSYRKERMDVMENLAEKSFSDLTYIRDYLRAQNPPQSLGSYLGVTANDTAYFGTIYATQLNSNRPINRQSGAFRLQWCPVTGTGTETCRTKNMPVTFTEKRQRMNRTWQMVSQNITIDGTSIGSGDLVAVRRSKPDFKAPQVVDVSSYDIISNPNLDEEEYQFLNRDERTITLTNDPSSREGWDIYARSVSIMRSSTLTFTKTYKYATTTSSSGSYTMVTGTPLTTLRNATYRVTVKLVSCDDPAINLTRTIIMTD